MATQNLGMGQMRTDWNSYFDSAKPGVATPWGGGTLTMGDNGEAKYAAQGALNGGTTINRNSIDNPNSLQSLMAQAPGIAQQWKQQYGVDAGLNANDQSYWNNTLAAQGPQAAPQAPQGQPTNPYMAPQGGNLGMSPQGQPSQPMQQTQSAPMQTPAFSSGRSNPWIAAQGQALTNQSNQNLLQNVLPSIGRGAQASGMYGSSRQGIAEGQAMGNAQTGLNSALAGMYSQAYGQDQQYDLGLRSNDLGFANLDLGRTQAANQYNLGLRSSDLGFANLDANINNSNFNNQLQGANFGLSVYDRMNGYGQQDIQNSTNMQNTPLNYFNQFNNNANAIAGQGGTSTNSQTNPGNPYIGALGGLQLGSQLFGSK